jgi:AraC-like DNA-binding protein
MKPIPLISADHVARIATLLEAQGVPANRYLEQARISPRVREQPDVFVPGHSVWALAGAADRGEGLGDFWLDIARVADWRRADWVRPMTRSVTLRDAIRAMCSSYVRQIPMNELGLTANGRVAWFWRRRLADVHGWPGNAPAEEYTLSFMLEVVRTAAGPEWLPERLKLECSSSGWGAATRRLSGVRIEYDQPLLAVAIPVPMLSIPVSIAAAAPPSAATGELPSTSFESSLRQVLKPWFVRGLPSQEIAAELLWMSPRTLRRRLAEEGISWRAVVKDLKFARAVDRLETAGVSIREIGSELGFTDAAHFTRFFRSRAGVPPSAYREEVERGRKLARQS